MKCNLKTNCSRTAVGFLILIQITATVSKIQIDSRTINSDKLNFLAENYFESENGDINLIYITKNNFSTLPENIFKSQINLRNLSLYSNQLRTLPENIFMNQNNLRTLVLSWNKLTILSENIFKSQNKLELLDFGSNEITTLPENLFKNLHNLLTLNCWSNGFVTLPENIFKSLNNLKVLDLSLNRLTTLPETIFKSQNNLEQLFVGLNKLTTLPENIFENQSNLQYLSFNSNELTILPENIFKNLSNLKKLSLSINKLTILPENIFKSLNKLEVLDLKWNKFTTLPKDIFKSQTDLLDLELFGNKLIILPENIFESQTKLQKLSLKNNKLTILSENIFKNLTNLENLDFGWNELTKLPENILKNQFKLKGLDFSLNKIQTLSNSTFNEISQNSNLTFFLNIDSNPWLCDCDFLEMIRFYEEKLPLWDIHCDDGPPATEKIKRPIISMIPKKSIQPSGYWCYHIDKYENKTICPILPENEITKMCPSECNCLFPTNKTSIFLDYSNNGLKNISFELGNIIVEMTALKEIEINFDNNSIASLPDSSTQGFGLITKISAKNNLIKSIGVENLPENLTAFDLSGNKLESLTTPVIHRLSGMRMLKQLLLGGNPWTCDEPFIDFIRFNVEKVDYEQIFCNDGEPLNQKHNRLTFSITNETQTDVRSPSTNSNERLRKLNQTDDF